MEYSEKSYNKFWSEVISKQINAFEIFVKANEFKFRVRDKNIKQEIWNNYQALRDKCKSKYMSKNSNVIDRHKVCACMMLAVVKARPFIYTGDLREDEDDECFDTPNEQLAITVGLSLLRGFIINSTCDYEGKEKSKQQMQLDKEIFKDGFMFPNQAEVYHGEYRNNFAIELYYTDKDNCYNILSLSNTLFLLEQYNRMKYELKTNKH